LVTDEEQAEWDREAQLEEEKRRRDLQSESDGKRKKPRGEERTAEDFDAERGTDPHTDPCTTSLWMH
jgi:hypothetical protein